MVAPAIPTHFDAIFANEEDYKYDVMCEYKNSDGDTLSANLTLPLATYDKKTRKMKFSPELREQALEFISGFGYEDFDEFVDDPSKVSFDGYLIEGRDGAMVATIKEPRMFVRYDSIDDHMAALKEAKANDEVLESTPFDDSDVMGRFNIGVCIPAADGTVAKIRASQIVIPDPDGGKGRNVSLRYLSARNKAFRESLANKPRKVVERCEHLIEKDVERERRVKMEELGAIFGIDMEEYLTTDKTVKLRVHELVSYDFGDSSGYYLQVSPVTDDE